MESKVIVFSNFRYFIDVIEKTTDDESEVELYEDGSWAPIIEKDGEDVVADRRNPPDRNGGLSSPGMSLMLTEKGRVSGDWSQCGWESRGQKASVGKREFFCFSRGHSFNEQHSRGIGRNDGIVINGQARVS